FGVFNGRITATADFFRRNAFDLIGLIQTSGIGGNPYKWGNYADMRSDGFEVSINSLNVSINDFSWSTAFNVGYAMDRITRLDFNPRLADAIAQGGAAVQGGPRRGLFSTRFAGLDSRGIPTFHDGSGERVYYYDLQERDNLTQMLHYEGSA